MKDFDAVVFIGRFQPFHLGHKAVVDIAVERGKEVIIVVGSSFAARSLRNPFTFEERKQIIKAEYPQNEVKVVPISDYPYNDQKWVAAIQSVVHAAMKYSPDPIRIALIGHNKDDSSYYLNLFPIWDSIDVDNSLEISATDIRSHIFNGTTWTPEKVMSKRSYTIMHTTLGEKREAFSDLIEEHHMITKYKNDWKAAPFPPVFVTCDAVVVQSGHVLLIERKFNPGKGLWAIPGGFIDQNETIEAGIVRELREETGLKISDDMLKACKVNTRVFDHPNRSARGRTITHAAFYDLGNSRELPEVVAQDDAKNVKWTQFKDVRQEKLFDDHAFIIDFFCNIL